MVIKDSVNIINKKLQTKENSTENFESFFLNFLNRLKRISARYASLCKECIYRVNTNNYENKILIPSCIIYQITK